MRICPLCKSRLWNTPLLRPIPPFRPDDPVWASVVVRNRRTIIEAAEKHKAHNPRVFGSVRRGTAGPASDLDLLVTFAPGASLLDQVALKQDLEGRIGRPVDVVSDRSLFWLARPQILAEAEPV